MSQSHTASPPPTHRMRRTLQGRLPRRCKTNQRYLNPLITIFPFKLPSFATRLPIPMSRDSALRNDRSLSDPRFDPNVVDRLIHDREDNVGNHASDKEEENRTKKMSLMNSVLLAHRMCAKAGRTPLGRDGRRIRPSAGPADPADGESAHGADNEWLVVVHWRSVKDADASMATFQRASAAGQFMSMIDASTMSMKRYQK